MGIVRTFRPGSGQSPGGCNARGMSLEWILFYTAPAQKVFPHSASSTPARISQEPQKEKPLAGHGRQGLQEQEPRRDLRTRPVQLEKTTFVGE
jgi:hypothetical protein